MGRSAVVLELLRTQAKDIEALRLRCSKEGETDMKRLATISAAGLMFAAAAFAQSPNTWFEQYHKAKYGRYSPMEEARQRAEQANTAFHEEATTKAAPRTDWVEQYFRAKFGRSSPMEEARQKAEQANTAFHEEVTKAAPRTDWAEQYFRAKFGRSSPMEEARRQSERRR